MEIIHLPVPEIMTPDQRQHWHDQAAYWCIQQENAEVALEYATDQRNHALVMLGMIGVEGPDGAA